MKIQDFVNKGVRVINDMGELRIPSKSSIPFPNGMGGGSIVTLDEGYSVAVCDYEGYFNWDILKPYGASEKGTIICKTEDEVCKALSIIELLNYKPSIY